MQSLKQLVILGVGVVLLASCAARKKKPDEPEPLQTPSASLVFLGTVTQDGGDEAPEARAVGCRFPQAKYDARTHQ